MPKFSFLFFDGKIMSRKCGSLSDVRFGFGCLGGERVDTKERKMRWFVRAKLCPNFRFCLLSAKLCPENAGHGRMFVSVSDAWGGGGGAG